MIGSKKTFLVVTAICLGALVAAAAGAAATSGPSGQVNKINPPPAVTGQQYTLSQTLSDQAQEATIAFDGLAFLTGSACSDTFLPPGKVADYAGFQYLRDNDPTQMGHNTDFVTRASDNVLSILNSDQLAAFVALSKSEAPLTSQYGYLRFPLMKAFRAQLEGTIPAGSSGLDKAAVMAYSAQLYDVDASISIGRATTYATVIRSLNQTQRAYLDQMASGGMLTWPVVDASAVLKNSGEGNSVAMRTYASEMFSWYAGSVDADVYFCPERQATYFGSFYLKDRPAMGNPGYSISTTLTGDSGEAFLDLLTNTQREKVTSLVDLQRADLTEIVAKRTAIATELRSALTGETIDENLVRSLSARYGELDGEISYYYATHFADVGKTLTSEQRQKMMALRNLDTYVCDGAYLYSQPISMPQNIPSDFLFGVGTYDSAQMSAWIQGQQQSAGTQPPNPLKPAPGSGNITPPGPGPVKPGQGQGNATPPSQGPVKPGQGQGSATPPTQAPPKPGQRQGNATLPEQGPVQGPAPRMPAGDIIKQLEQQGYAVTDVKAFLKDGNQEAVKEWLDSFKKNHPGVIEAIENSWSMKGTGGNGNALPTATQKPPGTTVKPVQKSYLTFLKGWFSSW